MGKRSFKVVPEKQVGKTQILYNGDEKELEDVRQAFSSVRSSEVYPSFDSEYEVSLFFYETSESFLRKLYRHCKDNLSGLRDQRARTAYSLYFKWGFIGAFILFLFYFLQHFVRWIIQVYGMIQGGF